MLCTHVKLLTTLATRIKNCAILQRANVMHSDSIFFLWKRFPVTFFYSFQSDFAHFDPLFGTFSFAQQSSTWRKIQSRVLKNAISGYKHYI